MDKRLYVEPMNDDWRLQIEVQDASHGAALTEQLAAAELEHELSLAFEDRLIVSRDGTEVFVYAGERAAAERARDLIAGLAATNSWKLAIELRRWHPEAERWEDAELPLPEDEAARLAEHRDRIESERQEASASGEPEFEVRVDLSSHGDAARLAERLRAEGLPAVRRWKYLVVGAADEDSAKALAARLEAEAPAGSEVTAEGSGQVAWAERPANPFAVFGGLGG
jgi:hypothetical protein